MIKTRLKTPFACCSRAALTAVFLLLLFSGPSAAQDLVAIPPLRSRVTDLTGTLTGLERSQLESKLSSFAAQKGSQVVVIILPSVRPETIEQFGIRIAERWKIGRKGVDDGAILIVAKVDRELRIEVGYGFEGALNDATSKRIIEEIILPRFRRDDFSGGISSGVEAIVAIAGGEDLPAPAASVSSLDQSRDELFVIVLAAIGLGQLAKAALGGLKGSALTGIGVFLVALMMTTAVVAGAMGLFAFLLTLGSSGTGGRVYRSGGTFGGGGFGGGGFSGGGGSFGGGGASGRW